MRIMVLAACLLATVPGAAATTLPESRPVVQTEPRPRPARPDMAAVPQRTALAALTAQPVPAPRPFAVTTASPRPAARQPAMGPGFQRPRARPAPAYDARGRRLRDPDPQCDPTGLHCIRLSHRTADTCRVIETLARAHGLPPGFFARLIWRESLFDPYAISPAGALGIAQFIPSTAKLRGLEDPFNPAEALAASAAYLDDLRDRFGNLGMAAIAYNGGEARASAFLARRGGLPRETRAYVQAITGHPAEAWRGTQPREVSYRLDGAAPFRAACIEKAEKRSVPQFRVAASLQPWAVIVAAHQSRSIVSTRYRQAARRNPVLARHDPVIAKVRLASMRAAQYTAQIGQPSRAEAMRLCSQIRKHGSVCTVLRNPGI